MGYYCPVCYNSKNTKGNGMSCLKLDADKIKNELFKGESSIAEKVNDCLPGEKDKKDEDSDLRYCMTLQLTVIREQEAKITRLEEQDRVKEKEIQGLLMEQRKQNEERRKLQTYIEGLEEQINNLKKTEIPIPPLINTVLDMMRGGATNKEIVRALNAIGYSWSVAGAVLHPDPEKELEEKGDRAFIQYARNLF